MLSFTFSYYYIIFFNITFIVANEEGLKNYFIKIIEVFKKKLVRA